MAQLPANIRVNALFPFPSLVTGSGPVTLAKANGIWTIGMQIGNLGEVVPTVQQLTTDYVIVWDSILETFNKVALSNIGQSAITMPAWTLRGNVTAASAVEASFAIDDLTNKASPAAADELIIWDVSGATIKKASVSSIASAGSVSQIAGNTGAFTLTQPISNIVNALILNASITPQGRPTLVTATPVMTTSQTGKTTVFYTPYIGNLCPIFDGTNFIPTAFAELSQATTDNTKSPTVVGNNSNYDVFVWNDAGTVRATRGPAWTSDTARGTGAGTTELVRVNGLLLNAATIVNGPAAQRGTYIGTIRSNGTASVDYIFGATAVGGTAGWFGVWSAFNRINMSSTTTSSTDSWPYTTANTWRAPNGSATMRASFVRGLDDDPIDVAYYAFSLPGAATATSSGIGLDSTTTPSGLMLPNFVASQLGPTNAYYNGIPGLGFHFVSALEFNSTTTSSNFYGDAAVAYCQTGLVLKMRI